MRFLDPATTARALFQQFPSAVESHPETPSPSRGGRTPLLYTLLHASRRLAGSCLQSMRATSRRRLQITETVALGDKRAISILQVDGREYLIGVSSGSISLLTSIEAPTASQFDKVLRHNLEQEQSS